MKQQNRRRNVRGIVLILLLLCSALGCVLYFVPVEKHIDRELAGIKSGAGPEAASEPIHLQIKGEYRRYLFRPDTFEGYLRLEGYGKTSDEAVNPLRLSLPQDGRQLRYVIGDTSKGLPLETYILGLLYADADFDRVLILIMKDNAFHKDQGEYACFPAETQAQAKRIIQSFTADGGSG